MSLRSRLKKIEGVVFEKQSAQTMQTLENLTDRACKQHQLPGNMGLSEFIDWLRGLYPELYKSNQSVQRMNTHR